MEYKKITQKEYLKILQNRNKSFILQTFQNKKNVGNCFKSLNELFENLTKEKIKKCYEDVTFLNLISGNKKRLKFITANNNINNNIYGNINGKYYLLNYLGFDFILNLEIDEDRKHKNFNLYTLNLSFLE